MKIDEIIESWKQDSVIDDVDLDREALKIPNLHAKYLRLLFEQRVKLRSLQGKRKELKRVLGEYYRGDLNNPEDLTEINREPWGKTVLKNELNDYVDGDREMVDLNTKIGYYEEVVSVLEEILKALNNRNFQIKNAIDWRRLTNFGTG
tara:strand:- start:667 stop:1110 length:444 start_codon:yes stop_codon:yes gene_type:complete